MFRAKLPAFLFLLTVLLAPASWAVPTKILPLGDSITNGQFNGGNRLAYRDELYDLLTDNGYDFVFVGTCPISSATQDPTNGGCDSTDNPSTYNGEILRHEGRSGFHTDWVQGSIASWSQSYDADIALIHLGTNDILNLPLNDDAQTLTELEGVISTLKISEPGIQTLVAKIIPINAIGATDESITFNQSINEIWRITNDVTAIVDHNDGMLASDFNTDLIHPNQDGEAKMASKWFAALTPLLTTPATSNLSFVTPTPNNVIEGSLFSVKATSTNNSNGIISYERTPASSGICTVNNEFTGEVTADSAGTCVIQATITASPGFAPATATKNIIIQLEQIITFTPPTTKVFGDDPFIVTATSNSGLAVAITSTTPTICSINSVNNEVTILTAGTCTLAANQAGAGSYAAAATVTQPITITKAPQIISFAGTPSAKSFGDDAFTATATSDSGLLPVTITSTTQNVCTIDATKTVTILNAGACTLAASQAGNANYQAATGNHTITISSAGQTIDFPGIEDKFFGTAPFQITATASSGLPVSYSSSTTSICTVSDDTVTLVKVGTCKIIATAGNSNTTTATASRDFDILKTAQSIDFPTIEDKIFGTTPFQISATASSGLLVSFTPNTPLVCTISAANVVTLISVGTCKITASAGNDNIQMVTVTREFSVLTNDIGNAKASLIAIINNTSTNDVTASQLKILGLTKVNADLDYTQALKAGTYLDPENPTNEELQKVIDGVNEEEIKTAGSVSSLWLILLGFAALYRRNRMSLK